MLIAATGGPARGDDDPGDATALQVHGFASQGALLTSDNNYLARTERGSVEFTEAGINFTKAFDDQLSTGIQLFARDLGPRGQLHGELRLAVYRLSLAGLARAARRAGQAAVRALQRHERYRRSAAGDLAASVGLSRGQSQLHARPDRA